MISLDPASRDERRTLENLLQLYVYDWSEILSLDVRDDGRFEDFPLEAYWRDDWRHPFLLRVDGKLGGFALVSERSRLTGTAGVVDMAEFFVMRKYRRQGIGRAAATAAFDRFKGPWEVRQRGQHADATAFWRRVISQYTNASYQEDLWSDATGSGPVQRFQSGPRTF